MKNRWSVAPDAHLPEGGDLPLQQHPAYGAACRTSGAAATMLALGDPRRPQATALVIHRRWPAIGSVALISRGPVWAPATQAEAATVHLAALLDLLAASHRAVIVTPERIAGGDPLSDGAALPMMTPACVAMLPVRPPEAQRAGLHQKWRNRLRRAEAKGLECRAAPMPSDPGHWLLRAEAAQARTRGYSRLPPAFAAAWAGAAEARLFTAHTHRAPVAGLLFLRHGPWATYHVGWTSEAGRETGAHNLLMWQAMLWARATGLTALDLGALDTVNAPGLARFKLGAGAAPHRLGATWLRAPGTGLVRAIWPRR